MKRLVLCIGIAGSLMAAVEEEAKVVASGGGGMKEGGMVVIQSIGQSVSTPIQQGSSFVQQGGFLGFVLMNPDLDTDGDGLSDELDGDNDGDTLSDVDENNGSSFSPPTVTNLNLADTDGDGATDAEEAAGGFNPLDASRSLKFDLSRIENGTFRVRWLARAGRTYGLYRFDLSDPANTKVLVDTATPLIGIGTWLETKASRDIPIPASGSSFSYLVEEL